MSSDTVAALQPSVRKQSLDLAGDLDRVKSFVAKFSSMGFLDVSVAPTRAHADHSNCTFVCSDMVSFLFRVEKLCPSREAALYVPYFCNHAQLLLRPFASQVCRLLERVGVWKGSVGFADAVQPIFFNAHVLEQMTQDQLRASLATAAKESDRDGCDVFIKRGVLEKKGRRQQFFDSWHPRYFVIRHGVVEHWRTKEEHDKQEPPRDTLSLLGCKIESAGEKHMIIRGNSLMNSLELKAKTQEELLDWRHALQRAMTPSASSIEEHMVETKKIHMQMSEVIQKHIDALQHDDGSLDSMMGAALQISIKSIQDLGPLVQKKSQKHEEFFVEVTCGARSLRTNCFKLDDPGSVDGTTLSEAHIDFGDDATLFFPVIRPTVTVTLMSLLAEGLGIKMNPAPKAHAQMELKISHFLNYNQGRHSINTVVPMPLKDLNHEVVLGFSMSLSGMKDLFGFIQDDWFDPKNLAQQLDLCFDRFKKSSDYFKSAAAEANSKVLTQKAIAHATFSDVVNTSFAFHETSVKVSVLEARRLMAMDSNGFSDPFCELILRNLSSGNELVSDKTPVVDFSLNPRWNWSKEYALQSAAVLEIRCLDYDAGMGNDFLGCAYIDLSDLRSQEGVQDVWLPLCDLPSSDNKHAAMRLFSLIPNPERGQIRVLIERLDKTNSEASTILSAELVHQAVRDCPSLRLQKKSLKLLLDSGNEREMATYLIMSRALLSEKFDKLSQLHSVLQVQHEALIESIGMLVKDDYETFCNVSDRAASVKFQEMHVFFSKTPDPVSDSYFVTIQIGDKEEMRVLAKPLPQGSFWIKFPDVLDMQCPAKEANVNIKLWCPMAGNTSKMLMLSSSSFPVKSIALGSHDKQILLKGRVTVTLSCRIVGEAANYIESQSVMQLRARYEASNKSKFALVKKLLFDDGGLLFTQFINTLDISELDSLCVTLVRVLGTGLDMEHILEKLIEQEVLSTQDEGTLFRRNSPATKLITAFTREVASSYLAETLSSEVESLIEGPTLELDPSKIVAKLDLGQQAQILGEKCHQIIRSLVVSIDRMPLPVRRLVSVFQKSIEEFFPKSKYIVSTGYLFLRVIVPYITSPDGFGLYHRPIDPNGRRNLILVSKVLQNLANDALFGAKEAYMVSMNAFMGPALLQLQQYISDLGRVPSQPSSCDPFDDRSTIEDQMRLHRMLLKNVSKMQRASTLKEALDDMQPPPENSEILIRTDDPCDTVIQRTKSIFRFFKEQLHQSHRIKEKDQANLEKTVTVFQEAIQALKAENEQMKVRLESSANAPMPSRSQSGFH